MRNSTQNINKLIIFDLDGTLLDTSDLILKSLYEIIKIYLDINKEQLRSQIKDSPYKVIKRYTGNLEMKNKMNYYWDFYNKNIESEVNVYRDIVKLLKILKQKEFGIGIVTSLVKKYTKKLIHYYLKHNFDVIITYNDTRRHKPNPEPLILARDEYLRKKGIQNLSAIYIGDSDNDIIAGKNAKMITGLAAWSLEDNNISLTKKYKPDYIFYKPLEILKIYI